MPLRVKSSWGHLGTYHVALRFNIKGQVINKYGHAIKSETEMGSIGTHQVALRFNIKGQIINRYGYELYSIKGHAF